jgi:hypothetical protein
LAQAITTQARFPAEVSDDELAAFLKEVGLKEAGGEP